MKKVLSVFVFAFFLLGVSCTKSYTCTCVDSKTNTIETTATVSGKNATEAASECMQYESATSYCNVQEGMK